MAYTSSFGGTNNNNNGYIYDNGQYVYTDGYSFPSGNTNSSGNNVVYLHSVSLNYLSNGYARIYHGNSGSFKTSGSLSGGGGFSLQAVKNAGSSMYFGRNTGNGGTTVHSYDGYAWTGGLCGSLSWSTVPTKPTLNSVTASSSASGQITINFSGPSSNGGQSVSGYRIYRNGSYWTTTTSGTVTDTGRTPGTSYSYYVIATNSIGYSAASSTISRTATGVSTAPQSLSASNSTTTAGAINLSWSAPSNAGVGGITGYKIYRGGSHIATTSGTGRTYTDSSTSRNTSYSYTVRARNAWSDSAGTQSSDSNTATITANGVPSAPSGVAAVASTTTAGLVTVSWNAPSYAGTGGITGYDIYLSTGTLAGSVSGSSTFQYNVTGLTPGTQYGFYVRAKNALTASTSTLGDASSTVYATVLGDPPTPTGVTLVPSSTVAGRLTLAWTAPALGVSAVTGYTVYAAATNTIIAQVTSMSYVLDGLTPGVSYSYYVKARNTVTDQAGSPGGPSSSTVSATPGGTTEQPMAAGALTLLDQTNSNLSGTKTLTAVTSTTMSYVVSSGGPISTTATAGTVSNTSNSTMSGTATISSIPGVSSLTYSMSGPAQTVSASGGSIANDTNAALSGTVILSAADSFNQSLSYAKTYADVAEVATSGTAVNNSNSTFNGTFTITAVTDNSFSYNKTASNVVEISAAGTATDGTNVDEYNGTFTILEVPTYNTFTYTNGSTDSDEREVPTPYGTVLANNSKSVVTITYRPGWIG